MGAEDAQKYGVVDKVIEKHAQAQKDKKADKPA
jgi:ATP-dependent protease ClpP protease subunit